MAAREKVRRASARFEGLTARRTLTMPGRAGSLVLAGLVFGPGRPRSRQFFA
jgi:hypothetical protein